MDFLYMLMAVLLILITESIFKTILHKVRVKIAESKLRKEMEKRKDNINVD